MQPNTRRRKLVPKRVETKSSQELWLNAFIDYIAGEAQLSENTIAAYRRDTVRFFVWLGNRQIQRLSVKQLADYVDWLHRQHLAPASLARHIVSLRLFLRYLQLEGILKENAAELLGSQKLWERMPQVLSPGQVDDLLTAPQPDEDKLWLRDRAILEFFYATGCRVSELTNLRLRDIHLAEGYCQCTGKGNKQRIVPVGRQAAQAFLHWQEEERPRVACRGLNESRDYFTVEKTGQEMPANNINLSTAALDWAFLSYKGRQIRREAMWELIKKYAVRIGAPMTISPHTMRHSFATHMLQGGADIRQVQEMLGHASIVTTQIYTQVDMTRLKALHKKCHPRG